jgi:hypothetical protein
VTAAGPGLRAAIPAESSVGTPPSGYEADGRRDPFVSLLVPKHAASAPDHVGRPRAGLAAVAIADVIVRGIVKNGPSMLAILESPDHKSFVAHLKDRLLDASIQSIDPTGVVFMEAVDAAGRARQIRKALPAAAEDAQQ